jgi:hypothetical protein
LISNDPTANSNAIEDLEQQQELDLMLSLVINKVSR